MAVTLAQAAVLSENDLQRGVIEIFRQESPILDRLQFLEIDGNAYAYNEEGTLPGVEFRAVNAAYSESTGTFNQKTETLVILGGDADVDTFIQKTRSNLNDQRAQQTRGKVKASSYKFQDAFFNGDVAVDANSFEGLKKRLAGVQVLDAATNGLPVLGADDNARQNFWDQVDLLLAACPGADVIYANKFIRQRMISSMRRLTMLTTRQDEFGRIIPQYAGVDIVDPGDKADGTMILPQTETQGTSGATASSIYAVRFGSDETDQAVTGLTNGGVSVRDLGEIDAKPVLRTRIEFFCGVGVFGSKGASRLRGVLNS